MKTKKSKTKLAVGERACNFSTRISCSPSLVLRNWLLLYFSVKTKIAVRYYFLNILIVFAAHWVYLRTRADMASINQALHMNRSHWKAPLFTWSVRWLLLQCAAALQRCMEQTLWSRLCCWAQWHWYFTHFKIFYFPNIIGLVHRTVQYAYHYNPND